MGAELSVCDGVYKVCGSQTENEVSTESEAKNQALDDKKTKEYEMGYLQILSSLLKTCNDKQTLYNQCDDISNYELLYRGSKNGYNIKSLHSKCDNISNIFIIIISTNNNVFGAYTSKGFNSESINSYISDEEAFIFSLKSIKNTEPQIFNLNSSKNIRYALFNSEHRLLHIGGPPGYQPDICLVENCDKSKGSFVVKNAYSANDGYLNGGIINFKVKELLIYTVSNWEALKSADNSYKNALIQSKNNDESKSDNNDYGAGAVSEGDDILSYASTGDFAEYGSDKDDGHKIHVYIIDINKESEFKEPVFVDNIDVNDINYAGNVIGSDMDWNHTLKRNEADLKLDVTKTLDKLKIQRFDCKVLVYAEDKINGDKLIKLSGFDGLYGCDMNKNNMNELAMPDQDLLPSISEDLEESDLGDIDVDKRKSLYTADIDKKKSLYTADMDRKKQMRALRMKYSSRRIILHGKKNKKMPKCAECNTYYHIQCDPINAYNGIGIVCDICGKNRSNNPEMLLEDHYYKCEKCEGIDICSKCYKKEKMELQQQHKNGNI